MLTNRNQILAIDPSLTSTGICMYIDDIYYVVGTIKPKKLRGMQRLDYISNEIDSYLNLMDHHGRGCLAVIEGYAMGIRGGGRVFDLGELGGVLRMKLWLNRNRIMVVPPSSLKMYACGKGNADKDDVANAVRAEYGKVFNNDDETDAYVLARMGRSYLSGKQTRRWGGKRQQALSSVSFL